MYLILLPDCFRTTKVTIFHNFLVLIGVFIHHIHQKKMEVIIGRRLTLTFYFTQARILTLPNVFTHYLSCWGRSKVYLSPLDFSTFIPISVTSRYVNKPLIKSRTKTFTHGTPSYLRMFAMAFLQMLL